MAIDWTSAIMTSLSVRVDPLLLVVSSLLQLRLQVALSGAAMSFLHLAVLEDLLASLELHLLSV